MDLGGPATLLQLSIDEARGAIYAAVLVDDEEDDEPVHLLKLDGQSFDLVWQEQVASVEWMALSAEHDDGPYLALAGRRRSSDPLGLLGLRESTPDSLEFEWTHELAVRDEESHVFGRTLEDEIAVFTSTRRVINDDAADYRVEVTGRMSRLNYEGRVIDTEIWDEPLRVEYESHTEGAYTMYFNAAEIRELEVDPHGRLAYEELIGCSPYCEASSSIVFATSNTKLELFRSDYFDGLVFRIGQDGSVWSLSLAYVGDDDSPEQLRSLDPFTGEPLRVRNLSRELVKNTTFIVGQGRGMSLITQYRQGTHFRYVDEQLEDRWLYIDERRQFQHAGQAPDGRVILGGVDADENLAFVALTERD